MDSSESLSGLVARILREVSEQWLHPPPEKDWGLFKRFLPAAAGSFTFFLFAPWTRVLEPEYLDRILPFGAVVVGIQILIVAVGTLWFGYLASWGEHPRGPVRLYFTGMVLPALTMGIITVALP